MKFLRKLMLEITENHLTRLKQVKTNANGRKGPNLIKNEYFFRSQWSAVYFENQYERN